MSTILFVNLPFSSPVSPPYSMVYLSGFIKRNATLPIKIIDLNAKLHSTIFSKEYAEIYDALSKNDTKKYSLVAKEAKKLFGVFAQQENKKIRKKEQSETVEFCLKEILNEKPTTVVLSLVYNSQAFVAHELVSKLKEEKIKVIVGGPAVTPQVAKAAKYLPHEVALLEELTNKKTNMDELDCRRILDFSVLQKEEYFTSELVIPIKTSSCCYYQKCAFCTHHQNGKYDEYAIEDIKESIVVSQAKKVFLIDDMIHKKRLLDLAKAFKPLQIEWMCQLRPTKDLDALTLKELYESGLRLIIWGVESGCNRVLDLMQKGTNSKDASKVLKDSKSVGITNVTYIMFGFPTETKEEFLETIEFLKSNDNSIDLVSTSIFGLQDGAIIFENPQQFGVKKIITTPRQCLPDKVDYKVEEGLHAVDAKILRKKYGKTLENINNFPKEMNIYREHMLIAVSKRK